MRKIRNYYGETYDFNIHIRVCLYSNIVKKYRLPKADTLKLDRLHNDSIIAGLHKHWSRKRLAQFDYTTIFDRPELKKHFHQECLSIFKYGETQCVPTLSERWKQFRKDELYHQQLTEHFEEESQASDTNYSFHHREEGSKSDAKKWLEFYATRTEHDLPRRPAKRPKVHNLRSNYVSQHPRHYRRRKSHGRIRDVYSSSSSGTDYDDSQDSRFNQEATRSCDRNDRRRSRGRRTSFVEDEYPSRNMPPRLPKYRGHPKASSHRRRYGNIVGYHQELDHSYNNDDYWESEMDRSAMDDSGEPFHERFSYADNDFFQHDDRIRRRYPRARKRSPLIRRNCGRVPSRFLNRHRKYLSSCVSKSTIGTRYRSQSRRRRRSSSYSSERTRTRSPSRWQHDLFSDSSEYSYSSDTDDSYVSATNTRERSDSYNRLLHEHSRNRRKAKLFRYRHRWDDLRHKLDRRHLKNKFRRRYGPD